MKMIFLFGDILVFYKDRSIIAHRVKKIGVTKSGKIYYTKGDANQEIDLDYTIFEDVIGVVRSNVRFVGYPTVLFNELIGGE